MTTPIITQFIDAWNLWIAMLENHHDPIGEGKTEPEAISDLKEKLGEGDA